MKNKIGIIGYGFVGRAIANAHEEDQLLINDPKLFESVSVETIKQEADWVYVSVPTPMGNGGLCDTSILTSVLDSLEGYTGLVISKCTALPKFYSQASAKYSFQLVHVPEFLTAANANADYMVPKIIIIGGSMENCLHYKDVVVQADKTDTTKTKFIATDIATASAIKYYANSFLANKVLFNNQFATWCLSQGVQWNNVANAAKLDDRLGSSHWTVPGPDGMLGYGGYCFPKDVGAVIASAQEAGFHMTVLEHTASINDQLRKIKP